MAVAGVARASGSPGDLNCDTSVNGRDVAAFALALFDPQGYEAAFPDCSRLNANLNCDAIVSPSDVSMFVDCLLMDQCEPCGIGIELVTVGNPGNPGQSQIDGVFGAVNYVFEIGKFEVTAGQYTAFLNAVAATDSYLLYNPAMWSHTHGCRIERTGAPGTYSYNVAQDWASRPVNFVSFGDALRFANWLHNGKLTAAQSPTTTEDGSYVLNGGMSDHDLQVIVRKPGATWVVPSENEWYKAAYHANDGATGNYFNYPMAVNFGISNNLATPDPGGHATYYNHPSDFTIGPPYYRTEVGAHGNSASPYGTFDQGGNVTEWNEAIPLFNGRGLRGGSYLWGSDLMGGWSRPIEYHSSDEFSEIGFRVVRLP